MANVTNAPDNRLTEIRGLNKDLIRGLKKMKTERERKKEDEGGSRIVAPHQSQFISVQKWQNERKHHSFLNCAQI